MLLRKMERLQMDSFLFIFFFLSVKKFNRSRFEKFYSFVPSSKDRFSFLLSFSSLS